MQTLKNARKFSKLIALTLVGALIAPQLAFAASTLYVFRDKENSDEYTSAASGEGETGTWSWAGPDGDLTLDNYTGYGFSTGVEEDLSVVVKGDNNVMGLSVGYGDLTLTGEGDDASLTVGNGEPVVTEEGEEYPGGYVGAGFNIEVNNLDLNLNNADLVAGGSLTLIDSEVDGSSPRRTIDVNTQGYATTEYGEGYYVRIDNSHVHVTSTAEEIPYYGWSEFYHGAFAIRSNGTNEEQVKNYMIDTYGVSDTEVNPRVIAEEYPEIYDYYYKLKGITRDDPMWDKPMYVNDVDSVILPIVVKNDADLQQIIEDSGLFIFENVEGDIHVTTTWFGSKAGYFTLYSDDPFDSQDVLIDPIPEPEPEPSPEPTTEPEPEPEPASAPETPVQAAVLLPTTGDASLLAETALIGSSGLSTLALALRKRRRS